VGCGMVQEVLLNGLIPIARTEAFDPHFAATTGLLAHGGRKRLHQSFRFPAAGSIFTQIDFAKHLFARGRPTELIPQRCSLVP